MHFAENVVAFIIFVRRKEIKKETDKKEIEIDIEMI